ncbi:uncharacterized protein LOC132550928 [Ylistrum balloti]|uniref:uncharacterized protein LOC132550928 n=1 Tax=Ylistrum balloti TaxID=509963 RepID=UPI0029059BED|nr:uncharacterized protein LOC132550928 [Ylistrum balloti]
MQKFELVCQELGVPIAEDKTVLSSPVLVFLGLEIDSVKRIKIPIDKLQALASLLHGVRVKKKVTLKKLQSLAGSLNFCVRAIPSARAFIRRFYNAMSGVKKSHHFIRVTHGMTEDIQVLLMFFELYNGYCSFPERFWVDNSQLELYTDSAGGDGSKGGGAYFHGKWAFISWPKQWIASDVIRDITFLELVPIVMSTFIWGAELQNKKILLHTDNQSLVTILNNKTSRSCRIMGLVHPLVLRCMLHNIQFRALHIPGNTNSIVDAISRKQWDRFRSLAPHAARLPEVIPAAFKQLISSMKLREF